MRAPPAGGGGHRVKGRNYDRVGNSQVVLERQGMDLRKRRQNDEIAKKTDFQPAIALCVCIQGFNEKLMQITQTSMLKYIAQFSSRSKYNF